MFTDPVDQKLAAFASVENPNFQQEDSFSPDANILALLISKLSVSEVTSSVINFPMPSFLLSTLHRPFKHAVFNVLYVRAVEACPSCFDRVGVGVIFCAKAKASFKRAKEQTIWLA